MLLVGPGWVTCLPFRGLTNVGGPLRPRGDPWTVASHTQGASAQSESQTIAGDICVCALCIHIHSDTFHLVLPAHRAAEYEAVARKDGSLAKLMQQVSAFKDDLHKASEGQQAEEGDDGLMLLDEEESITGLA